jgi:hypothetical protein
MKYNVSKKISALAFALISSFAVISGPASAAEKPVLDVIVPVGNTGNGWKISVMINEALRSMGYDSEIVHTANCVNTVDYIAKKSPRPGIFAYSGSQHVADLEKNCNIAPTAETFVTPFFVRSQAFCTRADDNFTTINEYLKGKKRVTVASVNSFPKGLYDDLSKKFGVDFVRVDYSGSGSALKGLLAKDTDLLYTGYTTREISNPGVKCWATTAGVNNTAKFESVFPKAKVNLLTEFSYIHGVGIDANRINEVRNAVHTAIKTDAKMSSFMTGSFYLSGDQLYKEGVGIKDYVVNVNTWAGK